ncbi:MAG: DNA-3-methyladenine glycosylase 2 family protein [Candidatus Micrarchaeota archaeon]|nr:DNA-3-methyladenine glycosylase 2 family protein [Candidatus Micrarchaeota archaeon]
MLDVNDFDMRLTIESGQPLTFFGDYIMDNNKEALSFVTGKGFIQVVSKKGSNGGSRLGWSGYGYSKRELDAEVSKRLGLGDDMESVYGSIGTDPFMSSAISSLRGMRITHNDPWEATLCFIISQFNNMKRIRLITKNLIGRFGEPVSYEGRELRLFPQPSALADASLADIRSCGTGFRDKYIRSAARSCLEQVDLDSLSNKDYDSAKEALLEIDGVGDKVADCILLFGYKKLEAFPIDLWVKRVVEKVYFNGRKRTVNRIHDFADERWKDYRGYAQQYIFEYGRRVVR